MNMGRRIAARLAELGWKQKAAQEENAELKTAEAEYLAKLLQSVAEYEASVAESKAIYDAEFDAALDAFVKYGVFE